MKTHYDENPLPDPTYRVCSRYFRPTAEVLESGTEITESDSSSSLQGEGDVADSEGDNAEDAEPVVEAVESVVEGDDAEEGDAEGDVEGDNEGDAEESAPKKPVPRAKKIKKTTPASRVQIKPDSSANVPYFGKLPDVDPALYNRTTEFRNIKGRFGPCKQYHLCCDESRLFIARVLNSLKNFCPFHQFVEVPPNTAKITGVSFDNVCIQSYRADGGCDRDGDLEPGEPDPAHACLWYFCMVLHKGPPYLRISKYEGHLRWLFLLRGVCNLLYCRRRFQCW